MGKLGDWGPENPHPLSRMKTELVWEGKYDEYGNRRPVKLPTTPLPLQRIETIDAPCDAAKALAARQGDLFDQDAFTKSSHRDDFRNMLIWGDNKLALAALLEQFRGKVDLIYIDPPFDVGTDFSVDVPFGDADQLVRKEQSAMEFVAYTDMWGRGSRTDGSSCTTCASGLGVFISETSETTNSSRVFSRSRIFRLNFI